MADAFLMLPDYNAMTKDSKDDELKEWQRNAAIYQRDNSTQNPCLDYPIATELGLILVVRPHPLRPVARVAPPRTAICLTRIARAESLSPRAKP